MTEQTSERYEFESGNIRAVEYFPSDERLITSFNGREVSHYEYVGVGEGVWRQLIQERGNIGTAFANLIRRAPYAYRKLEAYEPASAAQGVTRGTGLTCPKCNQPTMIPSAAGSVCAVCGNISRTPQQAAVARKLDPRPRPTRRRQVRKLGK